MAHDTTDDGWLSRLERITEAVLKKIHYAGMFFILLLTTAHVTGRYFFSLTISDLVELSSYSLVSMMFLCVPYTGMKYRHITIDILAGRWSRRLQAITHLAVYGLCLVTAAIAAWQTFIRGFYIMGQNQVSIILDQQAYFMDDYKIYRETSEDTWELFDLRDDPGETTDLSGERRYILVCHDIITIKICWGFG